MDPNANLDEQLRQALRMLEASDEGRDPDPHDALRLAELVYALDEWLCGGGFMPSRWQVRK